jgi:hypothetical protein
MAVGDESERLNDNLSSAQENANILVDTITSIGATLSMVIEEAISGLTEVENVGGRILKIYSQDLNRSMRSLTIGIDKQVELQYKFNKGQDISKELNKLREAQTNKYLVIESRINNLKQQHLDLTGEQSLELEKQLQKVRILKQEEEEVLKNLTLQNDEREEALGTTGKLASGIDGILKKIDKSGKLSKFINFGDAIEQTKAANTVTTIDEVTGKTSTTYQKNVSLTSKIWENTNKTALLQGVATALMMKAFDLAKQFDTVTAETRRNMGLSATDARNLNVALADNGKIFKADGVTLKGQLDSINAINNSLGGIAIIYNSDITEGSSFLLNRLKLSEDAVAGIAKQSLIAGKSVKEMSSYQSGVMTGVEREYGVRLNLRNVMEEANKTSGQLLLNTMKLPGGIVNAVATAKSLGTEFKAISNSLKGMLDFESSITAELEAELLTGKDLNLEKARSYVLSGDNVNAMKEIVSQVGSVEELQNMSVIAQDALASSVGMTSDQLADQILSQEAINTQLDGTLDRNGEQLLADTAAASIQEKLAEAMENLNDTLKTTVSFALILAGLAGILFAIPTGGTSLGITAGVAGSLGVLGGLGKLGYDKSQATQSPQDGISPSERGPFTITDKYGATAITAQGDNLAISPNISMAKSTPQQAPYDNKEARETNNLLKMILQKQGVVKMDTTNVGTAFSMNTYQIQ